MLYGNQWCSKKQSDIQEKINKKESDKLGVIYSLENIFGPN
jgi:hypothetical protein